MGPNRIRIGCFAAVSCLSILQTPFLCLLARRAVVGMHLEACDSSDGFTFF